MSRLPRTPAALLLSRLIIGLAGGPATAAVTERWTRQFGSDKDDRAYAAAVDGSGNVYVAGATAGALPDQSLLGPWDAYLRKYKGG